MVTSSLRSMTTSARLVAPTLCEERGSGLRRRRALDAEGLDDVQTLTASTVAERTQQGGGDHLLGSALRVVARLRAVDDATAGHVRRADRALTGVTRALLLEGLAAGARDLTATLGRVGALASRRTLCDDDLVDQRDVRLDVEERGGQLDRACLLAVSATDVERESRVSHMLRPPSLRCGRRRCGRARRGRRP